MKVFTVAKTLCLFALIGTMSVANAQFGNLLKDLEKAAKDIEKGVQQGTNPQQEQRPDAGSANTPSSQSQTANKQFSKYVSTSNACSLYNNPADLWEKFEGDLGKLLTLKEIKSEDAIKNLGSEEWVKKYDFANLRGHINRGYSLSQFNNDLPRIVSWYKSKQSGGACPWGMQLEEVAFIVQWVLGDYWTCRNSGGLPDSCRGQKEGFYDILLGVSNIEKFHAAERRAAEQQRVASSPEGIRKKLQENYFFFMLAQDCHEARKSMVLKYVDPNTFNRVRSAMKTIESKAKSGVKDLNTDAVWNAAAKEYSSSQLGEAMELSKRNPQKHIKEIQDSCTLAVNLILSEVPKEGPKKSF